MAEIRPFQALRPAPAFAEQIASLPYDVYTKKEARAIVEKNPESFLGIDRPETQFPEGTDMYDQKVYDKARDMLKEMEETGKMVQDSSPCFYLYALTREGRTQTGLVCCASVEDYLSQVIKKHENTREEKEQDRIRHVDTCSAHTGPIFLAYRSREEIQKMTGAVTQEKPLYDFVKDDGVRHQVWKVDDREWISRMQELFAEVESLYIADGHHRAASAVKAGLKRRQEHPGFDGTEEFNYFLAVLFPEEELHILDYNRIVHRAGSGTAEILEKISAKFTVEKRSEELFSPEKKGEMGMYLEGSWYRLRAKADIYTDDPVEGLDVSVLEREILEPVFGISDSRTDERMEFVGGIRGIRALKDTVDREGNAVAFSMYPTSMQELLRVADCGRLMPPKSTWFEPKLLSGLFIHKF